eukprot:6173778-Pleurochrysis_carterae.AAC.1
MEQISETELRGRQRKRIAGNGRGTQEVHNDKKGKRKGGAGRGRGAKSVNSSTIEEELMTKIGVPQQTWGDRSCWLWAVAGTLGKLEGREGPTENDLTLERAWRVLAIQHAVREHGIPMTEEEIEGLSEGVQYTGGRLTKGGT